MTHIIKRQSAVFIKSSAAEIENMVGAPRCIATRTAISRASRAMSNPAFSAWKMTVRRKCGAR